MILEAATLNVKAGQSAAFESAFREAQAILSAMPGYLSHELQRCIEREGQYLLLVRWESVAAHEEGFRKSPRYQDWRRLLHHFYEPAPTVLHYQAIAGRDTAADEREIRQLVATWLSATRAGDLETILGLMTDDAVFLIPGRRTPMGKEEFAQASRTPAGMQRPAIEGASEIQEIRIAGEWAWMWARLSVAMTPPGGPTIERDGHTMTILRRIDGRWKLARDANLLAPVQRGT